MKKTLLAILGLLSLGGGAHAASPVDWNYIPISSYTDVATAGTIMFSSSPIQFVGITISSPAPNSYVAFYRSTTPVFTAEIATQTLVVTNWASFNNSPVFIPMFEMKNTSYTFISKVGNAQVTYWFRCLPNSKGLRVGICPGLPWDGDRGSKIEFPD